MRYREQFKAEDPGLECGEFSIGEGDLVDLIQTLLGRNYTVVLKAMGCSMYPFIRDGDILHLTPASCAALRIGDVVAFRISGRSQFAVHRITRRIGDRYLLHGDCCAEPDGWIPRTDILGRLSTVERNGRKVSSGLGPERYFLGFLSGRELLYPILSMLDALWNCMARIPRMTIRSRAREVSGGSPINHP